MPIFESEIGVFLANKGHSFWQYGGDLLITRLPRKLKDEHYFFRSLSEKSLNIVKNDTNYYYFLRLVFVLCATEMSKFNKGKEENNHWGQ